MIKKEILFQGLFGMARECTWNNAGWRLENINPDLIENVGFKHILKYSVLTVEWYQNIEKN